MHCQCHPACVTAYPADLALLLSTNSATISSLWSSISDRQPRAAYCSSRLLSSSEHTQGRHASLMISACKASQQMFLGAYVPVGSSCWQHDLVDRIACCSRCTRCHRHALIIFITFRAHRPVWVLGKNPQIQCCLSLAAVGQPLQ